MPRQEIHPLLCSNFPNDLADFASRLGQGPLSVKLCEVVKLIHECRLEVSQSFQLRLFSHLKLGTAERATNDASGGSPGNETHEWLDRIARVSAPEMENQQISEHSATSDPESFISELDAYVTLVTEHRAYQWLLHRLRSRCLYKDYDTGAIARLRSIILESLSHTAATDIHESASTLKTILQMDWTPIDSNTDSSCKLQDIVTFTGTITDLQALPCKGYIEQVWPDTGPFLVQLLQDTSMLTSPKRPLRRLRFDDTAFVVLQAYPSVVLHINGTRDVIAEVAEKLAWLGAALTLLPEGKRTVHCIPFIESLGVIADATQVCNTSKPSPKNSVSSLARNSTLVGGSPELEDGSILGEENHLFQIGFHFRDMTVNDSGPGTCWLGMLRDLLS